MFDDEIIDAFVEGSLEPEEIVEAEDIPTAVKEPTLQGKQGSRSRRCYILTRSSDKSGIYSEPTYLR